MLNIRLVRTGRKRDAHYRIVVSDSARLGRVVETLGSYHPRGGAPKDFEEGANRRLDFARAQYWLGRGAQPSATVRSFLKDVSAFASTREAPAESAPRSPQAAPASSPSESAAEALPESPNESPTGASVESVAEPDPESTAESGEAPEEEDSASETPGA